MRLSAGWAAGRPADRVEAEGFTIKAAWWNGRPMRLGVARVRWRRRASSSACDSPRCPIRQLVSRQCGVL